MDSKIINFHLFRFHLLPLASNNAQTSLFEENKLSVEELKEKKNIFFKNILDELPKSKSHTHPLVLHSNDKNYYLFKLAQKKTTTITKNFKNQTIDNEPYVYVIVNNDETIQKIAISENSEAFSSPDVVKNILKKAFQKDLQKYGLNIEIEQIFSSVNFWEYVNKHQNEITFINFQYIKPNLANISKSLPEDFKQFSVNVNSHESHITIKAPEKGILENIQPSNLTINGLVEYISNGAGSIKMKVKNVRKQLDTNENPVILRIGEIDIEGAPEQVIKLYHTIVNE